MKAKKAQITARLDAGAVNAMRAEAEASHISITEVIERAIDAYHHGGGAVEPSKIAAMQAVIDEQERIIRRKTGKPTPKTKRVTLSIPLAELRQIDTRARHEGKTRAEYLRGQIYGAGRRGPARALPVQETPALPA